MELDDDHFSGLPQSLASLAVNGPCHLSPRFFEVIPLLLFQFGVDGGNDEIQAAFQEITYQRYGKLQAPLLLFGVVTPMIQCKTMLTTILLYRIVLQVAINAVEGDSNVLSLLQSTQWPWIFLTLRL